MARSVSLSDEAFAGLRHEKQASESDSDVVLRLLSTARRKEKDPMAFFRSPPASDWTAAQYDELRERSRRADIERARARFGYRPREET